VNINELRKQYPQYDKVDDETLSQKLYEVHYAGKKGSNGDDIKYNDFRIKFLDKDTGNWAALKSGVDTVQGLGYRSIKGWADSQYNERDQNDPYAEFTKPIIPESWTDGISNWAGKGVQTNIEEAGRYAPTVASYKDVDSIGSGWDYASGLAAQSIPYMAAAFTPVGIAGMAGGLSQEAYESQPEDEKNAARAIASGTVQMGLERLGLAGVLGKLAPKGAGITRRVATGMISEGTTEVGQDIVAQWGAGADIGEIDLSNWDENFVGGMAAGGLINAPIEAYKSLSGGNALPESDAQVSPLSEDMVNTPEQVNAEQVAQEVNANPNLEQEAFTPYNPEQPIQQQAPINPVENQGYEFFSQEESQGYDSYMINDLANTAYNTDPQVTDLIMNQNASIEQKISALNEVNSQSPMYKSIRARYDSEANQSRQTGYNQSMERMQGLQQTNEPIRQKRIKQEGIQQTKDDISLPKNNTTMLDMKSRVKAKRKKFKKILQTKTKGGLLALKAEKEMRESEKQDIRDRTGKRAGNYSMADKEKRVQQEIAQRRTDDWKETKLAREYQLAEDKGIDKEFSEIATAVSRAIQSFPQEQQALQTVNAQEALAEYVEQEEANQDNLSEDEQWNNAFSEYEQANSEELNNDNDGQLGGIATGLGNSSTEPVNRAEGSIGNTPNNQDSIGNTQAIEGNGKDSGSVQPSGVVPTGRSGNDNAVSAIDAAANEAATSPLNNTPEPTPAQQEAGNYKKGKVKIQGLDIAIENPKGSQRKGIDSDGKEWSTTMNHHYGDIKRTSGADGDPIDVFIGEKTESEKVFVVDQNDVVTGNFDEHKVMIGFDTKAEAKAAYLSNYNKDFGGFGEISETSMSEFKGWVNDPKKSTQPFNNNTTQATQPEDNTPRIEELSEKAIIIRGDTKPIKDKIKANGGKWNPKHQGWIFPKSRMEDAQASISEVAKPKEEVKSTESQQDYLAGLVKGDNSPKNLLSLKKALADRVGKKASDITNEEVKIAQEEMEAALVEKARGIVNRGMSVEATTKALTELYTSQPNLNMRSVDSVKNMAYSTPAPISYLANIVSGINRDSKVLEPTAGNGLLLLTNGKSNTTVNEYDPKRIKQLEWLGYTNILNKDATSNENLVKPKSQDVVIMNPPFGFFDGSYDVSSNDGLSYKLKDIDHIIAAKQLAAMKDDGRAFLILGANREAGKVQGGKTGIFLNWLYNNYNVTDHIEVDGKIYTRQGAAWPIRMIAIDGRQTTNNDTYAPQNGEVKRIEGSSHAAIIDNVFKHYEQSGLLDTKRKQPISEREGNNSVSNEQDTKIDEQATSPEPRKPTATRPTESKPSQSASVDGNTKPTRNNNTNEQGGTSTGVIKPTANADPKTGSTVREQSLAESDTTSGRKGDTSNVTTGKAKPNSTTVKVEKLNDFQAKYETLSGGFNKDILTPINMAKNTLSALQKVNDKHGGIDNFVARELNFASTKDLHDSFMGLQIDSIALAIDKIEQGKAIIIADQTGVGKGRQAAGIIRYAIEKGHIPVFITQKANLFSDMYGDLFDIGSEGVSPFIFNNGEKITHNGKDRFKDSAKVTKEKLAMLANGELPKGDNAIFLTYSQIQNDPTNPNAQQKAISGIADKAIFILDESHTAAGTGNHLNTFMTEKLTKAVGGVYLSATYAKRPDNLGLYNLTSISEAVDSKEELSEALFQGGLQLQTLLASMMSQEGELIRREKSFDGISINMLIDTENREKHTEMFDKATDVLSDIVAFSKAFGLFIKGAKPSKESPKGAVSYIGNATVDKDTKPTSFTSTVHNYIAQLTLAIKADSAADKAIAAFERGEKPVIALDNTMETKLNNYMASSDLAIGDSAADFTFADIFNDALNNATSLSVKTANGDKEKVQIPLSALSGKLQTMYTSIKNKANGIDFSDIPVSPIDHIRMRLQDAGVKVQEITGRGKFIDYSDNMIIKNKPVAESKENRISIVNRFNNGQVDAIILNQSGSTGLSLHAKKGLKNTNPRRMIVAQPSLDINIFMQMLGRINRTGQVEKTPTGESNLPRFDVLWLDLPSENRPAAVVANKMKQLNANTSANADSATSIDTVDFFNQYGNEIVNSYVKENPEILESLGISKSQYDSNLDDSALFLTGKVALLTVEKQREFFEEVETAYLDHIATLKATGEYALETQDVDLDAKPISQELMQKGENTSAFNGDIKLTTADVKSQGKPVSPEDLQALYDNANQESGKEIVNALDGEFDQYIAKRFDKQMKDLNDKVFSDADAETIKGYAEKLSELEIKKRKEISAMKDIKSQLSFSLREGAAVKINLSAVQDAQGAIAKVSHNHKTGQGNPYAPSKFKFKILTASGFGTISTSLSQLNGGMLEKSGHIDRAAMKFYFKSESTKPLREKRIIVTGNLVKAFSMLKSTGRVVSFTKASGGSEIGILLPASFDKETDVKNSVYVKSAEQLQTFLDNANSQSARLGIQNAEGLRLFKHEGSYKVSIPVTGKMKKIYLSDEMESIVGGIYYQNGSGNPIVEIDSKQLAKVYEFASANAPFKVDGELAEDFKAANNIDDGTGKVSNSDIRFNKVEGSTKPKGVELAAAKLAMKKFLDTYTGLVDDTFKVVITDRSPSDIFKNATPEQLSGTIKGGFNKDTNTVVIFSQNHDSNQDIEATIREELLVHKGLGVFKGSEVETLIQSISDTRNSTNKAIQDAWVEIDKDYEGFSETVKAEEFLAKLSHKKLSTIDKYMNKVVAAFTQFFRKLGLVRDGITNSEMRKIVYDISDKLRNGQQSREYSPNQSPVIAMNKSDSVNKSRRDFLKKMSAMAVSMAVSQGVATNATASDLKMGKAKPLDAAIFNKKLNADVTTKLIASPISLRETLNLIAKDAPVELQPLIKQIKQLAGLSKVTVRINNRNRLAAHGVTKLDKENVEIELFNTLGREGDDYGTLLHEALHAVVAARYAKLSMATVDANYELLNIAKPQNKDSIKQLTKLWSEFNAQYKVLPKAEQDKLDSIGAIRIARSSPDEFFVRALTDAEFQSHLASIEYNGMSMLQRFKDWVTSSLFGFKKEGTLPSWLDAALLAADDVINGAGKDIADMSFLKAINSFSEQDAITSNIRFNKTSGKALPSKMNDATTKLAKFWSSLKSRRLRVAAFKIVPVNQLIDVYDADYTNGHIQGYYEYLEAFSAYKAKEMSRIDEEVESQWHELQKTQPKAQEIMSRLMLNATMAQMSPDQTFEDQKIVQDLRKEQSYARIGTDEYAEVEKKLNDAKEVYDQLREDWDHLTNNSPAAVKLYKDVRQAYIQMHKDTKNFLTARIESLDADPEVKRQLMLRIKLNFEKALEKGDYFPLSRTGQFKVVARRGKEYIREHHDNEMKASEAAEKWQQEGYKTKVQKMEDPNKDNNPMAGYQMGKNLLSIIDEMATGSGELDFGTEQKTEISELQSLIKSLPVNVETSQLIDAIYQQMLHTLPSASAAKHFIHRNRVKGASTDMRRGFANTMYHSINRAAKIQYEHKFAEEINAIKEIAENTDGAKQPVVRDIHESLAERNQMTLNPQGSQAVSWASGLGFNWLLGGSPAAGIVNLSQVPLITIPYLAAKYGSSAYSEYAATQKYVLNPKTLNKKQGKNRLDTIWKSVSQTEAYLDISKNPKLPIQLKKLLEELQDKGKIDVTQMHALSQIADTETIDYKGVSKTKLDFQRAWGFFFHNAEVMNRQITAIMAINLYAKKENPNKEGDALYEGLDFNTLYDIAAKTIDDTQYNYASANRGMLARTDIGKLTLMFMTFTVNTIILMAKNAKRSFTGKDAQTRTEARRFMGNALALQFAFAGTIGLPMVEFIGDTIFMLINAGDDEGDEDFKLFLDESIREAASILTDDPNGDFAKATSEILRKGAINYLTGMNVASRVGLNNLLWRTSTDPDRTGAEMVSDFTTGASPLLSIAANFLTGGQRLIQGLSSGDDEKILRGVQGLLPKAIGDVAKGFRQSNYGESTLSGSELISPEEVNGWNAFTQAIGFSGAQVSEMYERRSRNFAADTMVKKRRSILIKKVVSAIKEKESMDDVIEDIKKFNQKFPHLAVDSDTIRRHMMNKATRDAQTKDGVYIPKNQEYRRGKMKYYDN
jgi:hypothetical protein